MDNQPETNELTGLYQRFGEVFQPFADPTRTEIFRAIWPSCVQSLEHVHVADPAVPDNPSSGDT